MLAHLGLYLAEIFGSVVWDAFTFEYKVRMDCFQYCPHKNCAVEIDTSSIESDESLAREFLKAGFTDGMLARPDIVEFDLQHQFTLHLCPDIKGMLGDENGDSATFKSNLSAATLATSRTAPCEPIHYLVPPTTPPSTSVSVETAPSTIVMIDTTDEADAIKTSPPPKKSSKTSAEDTPDNRLEESSEN